MENSFSFCTKLAHRMLKSKILNMGEPCNEDRAEWAAIAVAAFEHTVGNDGEDLDTNISDLLADLVHLCNAKDLDFEALVSRAKGLAQEEIEAEAE